MARYCLAWRSRSTPGSSRIVTCTGVWSGWAAGITPQSRRARGDTGPSIRPSEYDRPVQTKLRGDTRYIAIDGPPGAGVSALARAVAAAMGARLVTDPAAESPFREPYARAPGRVAFQAQMHCLIARYQQQQELAQPDLFQPAGVVADYVFARDALFARATLSPDELALYARIYEVIAPRVTSPDLVVYLTAPTETLRGRLRRLVPSADRIIKLNVIDRLAAEMDEYFFSYDGGPLLVINTAELDIVERSRELEELTDVIRKTRAGIQHFRPMAYQGGPGGSDRFDRREPTETG